MTEKDAISPRSHNPRQVAHDDVARAVGLTVALRRRAASEPLVDGAGASKGAGRPMHGVPGRALPRALYAISETGLAKSGKSTRAAPKYDGRTQTQPSVTSDEVVASERDQDSRVEVEVLPSRDWVNFHPSPLGEPNELSSRAQRTPPEISEISESELSATLESEISEIPESELSSEEISEISESGVSSEEISTEPEPEPE